MTLIYTPHVHQTLAAREWDAIVIGSGLGGMTSASLLALAGKRVLILERHYVPGGFTHTFTRKGFEWDVGVHYVGQLDKPGNILRRVFDFISEGKLHWASMGSVYDRAIIAGDSFDFVAGAENQLQRLLTYFPTEERALRQYFKLLKSVGKTSAWFFGEKTMPFWLSRILGFFLRRKFEKLASQTTYEVLSSLTQNERLIAVLCAQCGNYGLTPKKSSFGIHAVVVEHYLGGGSYPVGGASRIQETFLAAFTANGGELALKAEVAEILVERGRVIGVRMQSGDTIFCRTVISNAGARNTFTRLLAADVEIPNEVRAGLDEVKASTSHICLYVGLNGTDDELEISKNNTWIYDRYDFDAGFEEGLLDSDRPAAFAYISCPSAKDPAWAAKHPGKATIQVISVLSYETVKKWEALPWMRRGEEYAALKKNLTEKLLQRLYEAYPRIRGRVEYCELSTPLSTRHFMNYGQGEIYGLEHTPERFRQRWLRPQTAVKGLFLTGQDIVTVGAGGALMSGVVTALRIMSVLDVVKILRKRVELRRQRGNVASNEKN